MPRAFELRPGELAGVRFSSYRGAQYRRASRFVAPAELFCHQRWLGRPVLADDAPILASRKEKKQW